MKYREEVNDIFQDSLLEFRLRLQKNKIVVTSTEEARHRMNGICKSYTFYFLKRVFEENWYRQLSPSQRKMNLESPWVINQRKYFKKWVSENREHMNKLQRESYQRAKLDPVRWKKIVDRNKRFYLRTMANRVKRVWKDKTVKISKIKNLKVIESKSHYPKISKTRRYRRLRALNTAKLRSEREYATSLEGMREAWLKSSFVKALNDFHRKTETELT